MPSQTMAVVATTGDPSVVGPAAISALYGAVYALKMARKRAGGDFKVGPLRARWTGASLEPGGRLVGDRACWKGSWALPIPEDVAALPQKAPGFEVRVERWAYGTVAEALHVGPYATEPSTVERLHEFIAGQGYAVDSRHEEEYLTRPTARVPKTLIRYQVRKQPAA
jgi:hypothetical protein